MPLCLSQTPQIISGVGGGWGWGGGADMRLHSFEPRKLANYTICKLKTSQTK